MKRTRSFLVSAILLAVLAGMFLTSGAARAASSAPKITCGQWNAISSPNATSYGDDLAGVAAISPTDVWAVGTYYDQSGESHALAEHYDGTQWNVVPTANSGTSAASLRAIAAVSTNDVWAVGSTVGNHKFSKPHTLIEQWNGTTWNIIPSPNRGSNKDNELFAITAISANDIWAVGFSFTYHYTALSLTEHWDGTQWSIVNSPNVKGASGSTLESVSAASSNNVWAVGYADGANNTNSTLIEKWNGMRWKIVSSPNVQGSTTDILYGAAAIVKNAVWAVGYDGNGSSPASTLVENWDGKQWGIVASPDAPGSTESILIGIAAVSDVNLWSVGYYTANGVSQTLTEQWNGTQWQVIASPDPGLSNTLYGVAVVPGTGDLWAVGISIQSLGQTLIEYYC